MNLYSLCVLAFVCVRGVWSAVGSSSINCEAGSNHHVGSVTEGYEGDIEILNDIQPSDILQLEAYLFPAGVSFLELLHTPGNPTATVRTTTPLDADALKESGGALYYAVKCVISGRKNTRDLTVVDVNDNPPVFEQKVYTATVSEIQPVGFDVLRVQAIDADASAENSRVFYSIQPPVPSAFELRSDGVIRIRSRLNYNIKSLYSFTVEARDIENLEDTASVTITVEDFDNLNPYFIHNLYQASIPENQDGPFSSVTPEAIKAQDGDKGINRPVVYSVDSVIPNEYQSSFNIDPSSGVISVTKALDREEVETITIQVQAAQQDDSTKTANAVVSVTVEDVNDNPPAFELSEYTASIPENSPRDQFVLQTTVTDLDKGGFVGTLNVVPDTVPFSIGPDGDIRVKEPAELDREVTSSFTFQIEATEDPPSAASTVTDITITLLDENDNSPVFGSSKYKGKVPVDQSVGMLVVKVEATDLDEGPNGQISYSIDFGNEEDYFRIDQTTGEISLNKVIPLLQNTILQFVLYVSAKDAGTVSRSSSVPVHIQAPGESHPQFLQKIYEGKVKEDQESGAEIVQVSFFSVSPIVPVTLAVETEADKFSIDQLTGMLTTKVKLDYETQRDYTVQVSITDGTTRDEASVMVQVLDVNDNSPVFEPNSISIDIAENADVGHIVATVLATDADSGLNAEIRYTLEGSAGMFSVNPKTGSITIAAALDRETQDKYNLVAVAQDQGQPILSATASVFVTLTDVNDNPPIFLTQQYETVVLENATVGTNVISVSATDKDEGPNGAVTYHLTKQEPSAELAIFSIDVNSGVISLVQELDYSKAKRYTLQVEGRDGGTPSFTGSALVIVWVEDLNNKAPKFSKSQYDVSVYENIAPGSPLASLEVTDEDEGGFTNGHFLLTSEVFSINRKGVIHLLSNSSLDRETRDNYMIQVVAVDQPVNGLSSTAQIKITVLDVNDNNPQFSAITNPLTFPENKMGEVTKFEVTDLDIGENGRVSLTAYSDDDLFGCRTDGTLFVNTELDRETQEVYDVIIVALDNGDPPRNNVTRIVVILTDVNDNAPVFSQSFYSTRVLVTDVNKGDSVLTVSATDKDAGYNSLISYRFSSGSDMVDLDPETGVVTWSRDLTDITEDTLLELSVIAEDHGTPPKSDTASVKVEIRTSSLSDSMSFQNSTYTFSVKENEPAETAVGVVKVLTQRQVTYTLASHTDLFTVDKNGITRTRKQLNKEEQEVYVIEVEAADTNVPPNMAKTMLVVEVEDVNEAPVFESEKYTAEVFSVVPFRFPVLTVKASDPDLWDTEELSYSLEDSTSLLGLDSSSGLVYVMDLTAMGGLAITTNIKATDPAGLSTTAEIQVLVRDSDSNNVVLVTINQPVHTVQSKVLETQKALENVLSCSVQTISVRAVTEIMMLRQTATKTAISFIAVDPNGAILSADEVYRKLEQEHQSVKAELEKVFGPHVELEGANRTGPAESNNVAAVTLGVLLALSVMALVVVVVVSVIKFKKMKNVDLDQESFRIGKPEKRSVFTNEAPKNLYEEPKQDQSHSSSRKAAEATETGTKQTSNSEATLTSSL